MWVPGNFNSESQTSNCGPYISSPTTTVSSDTSAGIIVWFVLQADFFAFELLNGHIYLHLDLGSGGVKVKATTRRVDDGTWHEATLRRNGKDGRVTVDGTAADFSTPGEWNHVSVHGVRRDAV